MSAVAADVAPTIDINAVAMGDRFRKDFGDIDGLAASIESLGLLQPIGITADRVLVFGERRLRAYRQLGRRAIPCRIVDIDDILAGEFAENEVRKDFTPSERVAIARAIEETVEERRGRPSTVENPANLPEYSGRETRDIAAEKAGFGSTGTYRNAKSVADNAEPEVVDAMDRGDLSIGMAAEVAKFSPEDQRAIATAGDPKAAAKEHNHRAQGTGENEWYTPEQYVEAAREVMGGIDLDPASSEIANERVGAATFYTQDDDGLGKDWTGRVWLNPPYAQPAIANFAEKAASANVEAMIVLTHNYTDTKWFHRLAEEACAICFTRGRIGFLSPEGKKAAPTQGQAFFYFGSDVGKFRDVFAAFGLVVSL